VARSRPLKADAKRRRKVQLPARYSKEFPVHEGHHFAIDAIPFEIWERAKRRAYSEQRSMRFVIIKLLDAYGGGRLNI